MSKIIYHSSFSNYGEITSIHDVTYEGHELIEDEDQPVDGMVFRTTMIMKGKKYGRKIL